jgi:tetratricopeptide (TPR) repeat protein
MPGAWFSCFGSSGSRRAARLRSPVTAGWLAAAALALLLGPAAARAQTAPDTGADARARRHFASGESYYAEGSYEDAVREFTRAYELSGRAMLLYNLYLAEERSGLYRDAASHLERYLVEVSDIADRELLESRLRNLRERVAREEAAAAAAATAPTTAGTATTAEPAASTVTTTTTTTTTATSEPVGPSDEAAPPPSTPPAAGRDQGLFFGGVAAMAVGGAGLLTFAIAGGLALAYNDGLAGSECGLAGTCSDNVLRDLRQRTIAADVGLGIGAAGVVAGVVMLAVDATSAPGESTAVVAAPVVTADVIGIVVGGRL